MKSIYAVDFDGTIVRHEYPNIGEPVPYALDVMRRLQAGGARLILWTMRSGHPLDAAVEYCLSNGVTLWGINENPEQGEWTESPKVYALKYIDDAAMGVPLVYPADGMRPYLDWLTLFPGLVIPEKDEAPCRACSHISLGTANALNLLTCRECGEGFK